MMMKLQKTITVLALYMATAAFADQHSQKAETASTPSQAEAWLALQREGSQASLNKQSLSGPAMENIHKRYLESFTRPIPERFDPGQFNRQ